jgi:putative SOS response-associated peptidase YedK
MPVILHPEAYKNWLDPEIQETAQLENILQKQHIRDMKSHPVSKRVNRVENNSPACIDPLSFDL